MAKYAVTFYKRNEALKRSVTFEMVELLYILSEKVTVQKNKRKFCDIIFTFPDGDFKKAITVKKLPLYLAKRILPEKDWKILKK